MEAFCNQRKLLPRSSRTSSRDDVCRITHKKIVHSGNLQCKIYVGILRFLFPFTRFPCQFPIERIVTHLSARGARYLTSQTYNIPIRGVANRGDPMQATYHGFNSHRSEMQIPSGSHTGAAPLRLETKNTFCVN